MTGINRRRFLGVLASLPLVPCAAQSSLAESARPSQATARLASAVSADDGSHALLIRTTDGRNLLQHNLPARAHQVMVDSHRGYVVAVSRRPGMTLEVVDYHKLKPVARIRAGAGASFYGHAEMTGDGRYLMTTEKSPEDDEGRVVFRDAEDGYKVVRSVRTGGVGPHELRRYGDTLVVANGGIRTEGREKTNIASMQPSLVRLDIRSGEIIDSQQFAEEFHQASIRHIDVTPDGSVLAAMQYEGAPRPDTPLAGLQRVSGALEPLPIPAQVHALLRQYCGSACVDVSGQYAAISAPRGNTMMFWSLEDGGYLGNTTVRDGCGLARADKAGQFYASSGTGRVYLLDARDLRRERIDATPSLHWDNHMVNLG